VVVHRFFDILIRDLDAIADYELQGPLVHLDNGDDTPHMTIEGLAKLCNLPYDEKEVIDWGGVRID